MASAWGHQELVGITNVTCSASKVNVERTDWKGQSHAQDVPHGIKKEQIELSSLAHHWDLEFDC